MSLLDYIIIVVYFVVVIGVGIWYRRRAARSLDSYVKSDLQLLMKNTF